MTHTTDEIIEGQIVEETVDVNHQFPTVYVSGQNVPDRDQPRGAAHKTGALVPLRQPTVDEILAAFHKWMRHDVADGAPSPETTRAYFCDVSQFLHWLADEGLSPVQAGEEDVKAYRAHLVETYAVSTVGRKLVAVRRFYQMAQARGAIPHNPAEGIAAPRDKTERAERVKYLPWLAVKQLLATPNPNDPKGIRDRAILVLMALHGLRVIEVHRLDLENLDPEGGEAGTLRVFGKGDKVRTIHLTEETHEELKKWLAVRDMAATDDRAFFVSMHWSEGISQPGRRLSRRGIRAMVDSYLEVISAKKEGVSCHSLRHSYATHAYANGAELAYISKEMGHADESTTQVYRHLVERDKNNPAKFLTGLL